MGCLSGDSILFNIYCEINTIMLLTYYIMIQYIMLHYITFVNSSFLMLNEFHSVLFSSLQFLSPLIWLLFYSYYILSHSIIFSCDKNFYLYFFPIYILLISLLISFLFLTVFFHFQGSKAVGVKMHGMFQRSVLEEI